MQTHPTSRPPQTIKQAKADYKKHGPRISSQESRQLERGAELYRRAEKIRENEKKREVARKRKEEREDRERDARRRLNIASPKPAIARSQCLLEGFVRVSKPGVTNLKSKVVAPLDAEPWSEDDLDDGTLLDAFAPQDNQSAVKVQDFAPQHLAVHLSPKSSFSDLDLEESSQDDFLESNTQVVRDMVRDASNAEAGTPRNSRSDSDIFACFLSTQDVSFSADDLVELGQTDESDSQASGLPATVPATYNERPHPPHPDYTLYTEDLADLDLDFEMASQRSPAAAVGTAQKSLDRKLMPPPPPRPRPKEIQSTLFEPESDLDGFLLSTQDFQDSGC